MKIKKIATLLIQMVVLISPVTGIEYSGTIYDKSTGHTIQAVSITDNRETSGTFSDENGAFSISNLHRRSRELIFSAANYRNSVVELDTISGELSVEMVQLSSEERSSSQLYIGKLLDQETKTPLSNVTISFDQFQLSCDRDGFFSITATRGGSQQVSFSSERYRDSVITLHFSDSTHKVTVHELEPRIPLSSLVGSFTGVVIDDNGIKVDGATVEILRSNRSIMVDERGEFTIDSLFPGRYTAMISSENYAPKILNFELGNNEIVKDTVQLFSGDDGNSGIAKLEGVVRNGDNERIASAFFRIDSLDTQVNTDSLGLFFIDSLPSGVYRASVWADGYDTTRGVLLDLWSGETASQEIILNEKKSNQLSLAEGQGAVTGVIVAGSNGAPLVGARISLRDNGSSRTFETVSDGSGVYSLAIRSGEYELTVISTGFEKEKIENLTINNSEIVQQDLIMASSDAATMATLTVQSVAVQSGSQALLKERQNSFEVVDAVGADQFKSAGASSAADAMKSVTGVTIVDGKYVVIRGLPAKYSVVMLNNQPLPSADPDEEAVHMDMFPASIIENIRVYKSGRPTIPANFAGGVVNVSTKPFPTEEEFNVSFSSTYRTATTFSDEFLGYSGGKTDWLGMDDGSRELASIYDQYSKDDITNMKVLMKIADFDQPLSDENLAIMKEYDALIKAPNREMEPITSSAIPGISLSSAYGNSVARRNGDRFLGYNFSLSYKSDPHRYDDMTQTDYTFSVDKPNEQQKPYKDRNYDLQYSKRSVLWNLMGNGSLLINEDNVLNLDYLFLKNGVDKVKTAYGFWDYYKDEGNFSSRRLHYTERTMNYVRFNSDNTLYLPRTSMNLDWNGAFVSSKQEEPDMRSISHFELINGDDTTINFPANSPEPTHQWRTVNRKQGSAGLIASVPFYQWSNDSSSVSIGTDWNYLQSEQNIRRLSYTIQDYATNPNLRPQEYLNNDHLGLRTAPLSGSGYDRGVLISDQSEGLDQRAGHTTNLSFFGMVELPLTSDIQLTTGVRYEYSELRDSSVEERWQGEEYDAISEDHDLLPSVALAIKLPRNMLVKSAYSRTVIRPSMREMAEYSTENFTGGPSFTGNNELERSLIDNVDLRWEWFPKAGELLAIGGYYKVIHDAIELQYLQDGTSDGSRQPINTSDAKIAGIEMEFIKKLNFVPALKNFSLNSNLTLTWSKVELDENSRKQEVYFPDASEFRPFQGQSSVVGNLFINYKNSDIGFTSSIYYNMFGTRLAELTATDVPWMWEKPYHTVNFTAGKDLGERFNLSFKAKNILNQVSQYYYEYKGEEYITRQFRKGASFSIGVKYEFGG